MKMETQDPAFAALYLCGCVLSGATLEQKRLSGLDLKKLYQFGQFHSLSALVWEGLQQAGYAPSAEEQSVYAAFREAAGKAVRKNLLLDTERAKLFAFLEQNGIWHMPLKGVILKELYPKLGLRQMADNDILFDESYRKLVRDWFLQQGYQAKAYGTGNHDSYLKAPIYNFEMHVALYSELHRPEWSAYYASVKARLIGDAGSKCRFHFTDEDFYIYFVVHGFKHYDNSGTGLRFLLDLYVWLRAKHSAMNFAYIGQELHKLGLDGFEQTCRALVSHVFESIGDFAVETLPPEERELLLGFLKSGTYGTAEQRILRGVEKRGSKWSYVLWRFFPGTTVLRIYHPVFRHKLLLPIGWVYRAVEILRLRPRNAKRELLAVARAKGKRQ